MTPLQSDSILITGGAGFIGSALGWGLNQRGLSNLVLSDHLADDERWKNMVGLRFVDYLDANDLIERLENNPDHLGKVGLVLHLGACSSTTERDAGYLMRNNFEYTKRLAHWSLGHGARFVYASSAATYGSGNQGMDDTNTDLHRLRPLNAYGYSKHLFDTYAQTTGIDRSIIGLKYFNVFGPNENHKGDMRSLVNKSFDRIHDTGKAQLFKSTHPDFRDGEQMRDFLYIKDAVDMTLHLALDNAPAGLYNLGSGVASTWIELTTAIFEAMGREPAIEFIEMPEALREKYQNYTCADISKLRSTNYTRTVTPLARAVHDYITNYLAVDALLATPSESHA
jgi:ADP-L-glycero-D-manno-heptose 6-epimerase